jgi:hypothetical protein
MKILEGMAGLWRVTRLGRRFIEMVVVFSNMMAYSP